MSGLLSSYQPKPIPNDEKPCWDVVIEYYENTFPDNPHKEYIIQLFKERDNFGRSKHGVPLQPYNGRNSLIDMLQEVADSIVYLQKAIIEIGDMDGILTTMLRTQIVTFENAVVCIESLKEIDE
jgi:hypothetical protein